MNAEAAALAAFFAVQFAAIQRRLGNHKHAEFCIALAVGLTMTFAADALERIVLP